MQQGDPFYSCITNSFLFIKAQKGVKSLTLSKINLLSTAYAKGTTSFSNKENVVIEDYRIFIIFQFLQLDILVYYLLTRAQQIV